MYVSMYVCMYVSMHVCKHVCKNMCNMFGEKTREARLRWYGHLRRKDDGYIGRRMLRMELPGKRKRGRPKRRFMDVVKEDMAEVEVTEEDTVDRRNWRKKIRCGDP